MFRWLMKSISASLLKTHLRSARCPQIMKSKFVVAQLGCGYWGPNLLRNFSSVPDCWVKYVVDSSADRRGFVESNFPRTNAVDSVDVVLNDPEVQAVIIATPAGSHF